MDFDIIRGSVFPGHLGLGPRWRSALRWAPPDEDPVRHADLQSWTADEAGRQTQLIQRCGLPTAWPDLDPDAVLRTLQGDKKVKDGRLRFVLPTAIGRVEIRDDISRDEILHCLDQLRG